MSRRITRRSVRYVGLTTRPTRPALSSLVTVPVAWAAALKERDRLGGTKGLGACERLVGPL